MNVRNWGLLWGLAAALVGVACSQTTDCDYVDKDPTGNLPLDIVGCWQTFGIDSLVVYEFDSDGAYRLIEPGGSLFGSGQILTGNFILTQDVLDLQNGTNPTHVQITRTSLDLTDDAIDMRRAVCRGYGFEHGRTCPSP